MSSNNALRGVLIGVILAAFFGAAGFIYWALLATGVSSAALDAAKKELRDALGVFPEKGTLLVVDFTQPSFRKRLAVIDLESKEMSFHRVAHGRNSGGLFATEFSDAVGSKMSSLGLYRVEKKFQGRHGPSIRLIGLGNGVNSHAEIRGIIIHSAEYVSLDAMLLNAREGFRIGRSHGCFALDEEDFSILSRRLLAQAYLFAYGGR